MSKKNRQDMGARVSPALPVPPTALELHLGTVNSLIAGRNFVKAFDQICLGISECEQSAHEIAKKYEDVFLKTISALCEADEQVAEAKSVRAIVANSPRPNIQLIIASWLRSSAKCLSFPTSNAMERDLSDVADDLLSEVYGRLGIDPKMQQYEKRRKLTDALTELERNFHLFAEPGIDIAIIGTVRPQFMKLFKHPLAQAIV
jgi:hypothetical protein